MVGPLHRKVTNAYKSQGKRALARKGGWGAENRRSEDAQESLRALRCRTARPVARAVVSSGPRRRGRGMGGPRQRFNCDFLRKLAPLGNPT